MRRPQTPAGQELVAHLEAELARCERKLESLPDSAVIERTLYTGWRDAYGTALRQVRYAVPRIETDVRDESFSQFQEHYG